MRMSSAQRRVTLLQLQYYVQIIYNVYRTLAVYILILYNIIIVLRVKREDDRECTTITVKQKAV